MSNQSGYKKQQNLSLVQLLAEAPSFVVTLTSAIFANTMLLFVDLLDSLGNLLRNAIVTILSGKLSKDLRYKYNYGIGKIEAIASLFCDGIVFFGLLSTIGMSVHAIIFPENPSNSVIAVVGLKVINVCFDSAFFVKQRKILKEHPSAISETNHAAALSALLFDSVTLVSLLAIWLFRNNEIGGYISPIISIFIAVFLTFSCIRRIKSSIEELTDKTLPENMQMKMLNILIRGFYNSFSAINAIKSRRSGDELFIDLHLSFEKGTSFEDIVSLQKQMQEEFDRQIGNCTVNIIVGED